MPDPDDSFSDIMSRFDGGIRLVVKARPGSSRARAPRIVPLAGDKRAIEITVSAAPEDGKANKAILALLAKEFGMGKENCSVKSGGTGKLKIIEIRGDPCRLGEHAKKWLTQCLISSGI